MFYTTDTYLIMITTKEVRQVMSKRLNSVFFGLCFITSLVLEIYCIHVLNGDLFTTIGIGIVVLITGYLLLDSIRSQWKDSINTMKCELENTQLKENEKLLTNLNKLLDLQKASYAATKKNTIFLNEEIKDILENLKSLEKAHQKALNDLIIYQKKSMQGQKKALNLKLNYSKENTKQLKDIFQEESVKLQQKQESLLELLYQMDNKTASDMDKPEAEAESSIYETEERPEIRPLYDDPNKNLTAEEIS